MLTYFVNYSWGETERDNEGTFISVDSLEELFDRLKKLDDNGFKIMLVRLENESS